MKNESTTNSGTEAEADEETSKVTTTTTTTTTHLHFRTLSAENIQSIDGETKHTALGVNDYDGRFNPTLHITQRQTARHESHQPCNKYFQPHAQLQQQQQQHLSEPRLLHHHSRQQQQPPQQHRQGQRQHLYQVQPSEYTSTMDRSLITEDVKIEELQLSEDECQKENQFEKLLPEEGEERLAKPQLRSHDEVHQSRPLSQPQLHSQIAFQCDSNQTDELLSDNKFVMPTRSPISPEVANINQGICPQPGKLNEQAALPLTVHPLSLHKDLQFSKSPLSTLGPEGGDREKEIKGEREYKQQNNTEEQIHTPLLPPHHPHKQQEWEEKLEKNKSKSKSESDPHFDQQLDVSVTNTIEASGLDNNSVDSETAMTMSSLVSVSVADTESNSISDADVIKENSVMGLEPIHIDKPNELSSLAEPDDIDMTTKSSDEVNGDQSLPVSFESQSPVLETTSPASIAVDQHSSEEELECINQENSHPEKRKWSEMNGQSNNTSEESNHPKSSDYHSFHPPYHHNHQSHNNHNQLHHPISPHHNHNHQQNHHILNHHLQRQSNINQNQQYHNSSGNNNCINSQQHSHNYINNQLSNNNNSNSNNNIVNNSNNSILINNSNICNNNNNINSNMNNNANSNSCCFTDSAGSSDEEVKEFMLDPKPILFSSTPPSGIQKVMRSSSANFLVPNGPPLSICAISPRKRHRLSSSSDSLDLENISVIQRPCLDFEKMQKTLMRKHTSHNVSRAKIVKIKTISGNGTSSKCWFDPAVCSFRSISTAYSPLPAVEEPSCAY
ncbi:homeobox protein 13-like [Argonauta hians]